MDEATHRTYSDYMNQLRSERHSSFVQFDKAILSLSGGTLAVSIAFIKDLVPPTELVCLPLLLASWVLLGLSIASTVVSFLFSQNAYARQTASAERYFVDGEQEARETENPFSLITSRLNYFSAACFLSALLATIIFAGLNLSRANAKMGTKETEMSEAADSGSDRSSGRELEVQEGSVPPQMPRTPSEEKGAVPAPIPKTPQTTSPQDPPSSGQGATSTPSDSSEK